MHGGGGETWPMKVEHELKLNRTEMIRRMCRHGSDSSFKNPTHLRLF